MAVVKESRLWLESQQLGSRWGYSPTALWPLSPLYYVFSSRESQEPHFCQAAPPCPKSFTRAVMTITKVYVVSADSRSCFTGNSSDPDGNPLQSVLSPSPFYRCENWGTERLNNLPKGCQNQSWAWNSDWLHRQGSWAQHLIAFITSSLQQPRGSRYQPGLEALGKGRQSICSLDAGPKP